MNDLRKYIIADRDEIVSLVINGGVRNLMPSDARALITYYRNKNPLKLADIVNTIFKYMNVLSSDPAPEAVSECTRLFEFIFLVIEMFGGEYRISESLGYRARKTKRSDNEIDKQIVEIRYNQPVTEDDDDVSLTTIGG